MKKILILLIFFPLFFQMSYAQDTNQNETMELLKENRALRQKIEKLEIEIKLLKEKLSQYDQETISIGFTFIAPEANRILKAGEPCKCNGNYTSNTKSKFFIWLALMDAYMDGYYIQSPVNLMADGKWEGRITLGQGITKVVAIKANKDANKELSTWLANKKFGKQYKLPDGADKIAERNIVIQ